MSAFQTQTKTSPSDLQLMHFLHTCYTSPVFVNVLTSLISLWFMHKKLMFRLLLRTSLCYLKIIKIIQQALFKAIFADKIQVRELQCVT